MAAIRIMLAIHVFIVRFFSCGAIDSACNRHSWVKIARGDCTEPAPVYLFFQFSALICDFGKRFAPG
jgi:hypothetical protein